MLSGDDRDRLKVLHEVEQKHLTQRDAGQQLRLSERWVRKLLARNVDKAMLASCTGCQAGPQTAR
jgi:Homeodomain-like domain